MRPLRAAVLSLLLAPALLAAQRPANFDAVAEAPPAERSALRAMAARSDASGAIPTEWQRQLDVPSFVWFGGISGPALAKNANDSAEIAARQELYAHASMYGLGFSDVANAYAANVHDTGRGAIIVKFRQRIDGVDVFRDELSVVLSREQTLLAMSGYLAPSANRLMKADPWRLDENAAVAAALRDLDAPVDATALQRKRVWFHLPDRLEPAYYLELDLPDAETTNSDMFATVISATDGSVLWRKNLTEDAGTTFTYRVWAQNGGTNRPMNGPQGFGGAPSPTGLLDGYQAPFVPSLLITLSSANFSKNDPWLAANAADTNGNNADAYADFNSPDGFTSGRDFRAATTAPNTFNYTFDLTRQPEATTTQRNAAIVQLFYTVNYLHDLFYDAGFDEAAGNAQANNYGRGGVQGDSIRAEAQDYGGRNNANMSTPSDGGRPRMQMYLFDGIPQRTMLIDSPSSIAGEYATGAAEFGATSFDLGGDVVTVTPPDACSPLSGSIAGKIAFIDRDNCAFQTKAQVAKTAGAIAVIVGNTANSTSAGLVTRMGCSPQPCDTAAPSLPPSLLLAVDDANALRSALAHGGVHLRMKREPQVDRDGSLDAQVVAHEWAHYLANRLIANATGLTSTQSRGMGEGWSDFNALLLTVRAEDASVPSNATWNGVYGEGNYVTSGGNNGPRPNGGYYFGIRRVPYSTDMTKNPLTLRHITKGNAISGAPIAFNADGANNAEVHATGEVWATMLWECYAALLRDTLPPAPRLSFADAQQRMREYLVASLKMTPPDPTFLEARNALLAAAYAQSKDDYRIFWQAFAKRGAGVLAAAGDRYSSTNLGMVEDFTLGNAVTVVGAGVDDESIDTCNTNHILDGGESGHVLVTIRNSGNGRIESTTVRASSGDSRLTFATGMAVAPAMDPGESQTVAIQARLAATAEIVRPLITINANDVVTTFQPQLNAHEEPKTSRSDDVEGVSTAWSSSSPWSRNEIKPAQHVWKVNEPLRVTDASLVSPPLVVSADGVLTMTFRHRYSFDISGDATTGITYIDGGVIEISTDDGKTWIDAGSAATPGYSGPIAGSNANPIEGRRAFGGQSASWNVEAPNDSPFTNATMRLNNLANKTVRVRFRVGYGATHASFGRGWEIDDIAFDGITNLPFPSPAVHRPFCQAGNSIVNILTNGTTIEAIVTSPMGATYGTVEFLENDVLLAAAPLVNGKASWNAGQLTPGAHAIVASYIGSADFASSRSLPLTVTIENTPRRHTVRH